MRVFDPQLVHPLVVLTVGLCWLTGCGDAAPRDAQGEGGLVDSGAPLPKVQAYPADLTTNHDGTTVRIALWAQFEMQLQKVAPHASLRSLSSDGIVLTTTASGPLDGGIMGLSETVLTPAQPLSEGWYALVLSTDAKTAIQSGHKRTDGGWESRFRVGSDPRLLAVSACASKDDGLLPKLRIETSELTKLTTAEAPVTVVVDGAEAQCTVYSPPSAGDLAISLSCTPTIPVASQISVTVGAGIVGASSDKPLHTSAGPLPQTFELPPGQLQYGCRSWRETEY